MSVEVKMMKHSVDGEQERSRECERQRGRDEEERIGEFSKRVIGSPGEEVISLHFGDHTRTLNGEEISMHETYNHSERETEIDLLQDVVKRLQQEIQDMSVSRFKEQDKLIDMKSK